MPRSVSRASTPPASCSHRRFATHGARGGSATWWALSSFAPLILVWSTTPRARRESTGWRRWRSSRALAIVSALTFFNNLLHVPSTRDAVSSGGPARRRPALGGDPLRAARRHDRRALRLGDGDRRDGARERPVRPAGAERRTPAPADVHGDRRRPPVCCSARRSPSGGSPTRRRVARNRRPRRRTARSPSSSP